MDAPRVKSGLRIVTWLDRFAVGTRGLLLAAVAAAILAASGRATGADETATPAEVVDRFLDACSDNGWLDEQQREKVRESFSSLSSDDPNNSAVISDALREVRPDFAAALKELSEKQTDSAVAKLRPMAEDKNPYVAAESAFLLAKAHISQQDHEKALPLLTAVIEKHSGASLRGGEALLLRAICELEGLQRRKAGESFAEFLEQYPDSPRRMLATARQNLLSLEGLELGSLDDIHDQIEYSRRRLSLEDSGEKTQDVQDEVVTLLTSLIEEIEKKGGT